MQKIYPCLWFDNQAEEAVKFYSSLFKNSKITITTKYSEDSAKAAHQSANSVMSILFQLEGLDFMALNGGPMFKFSPAFSFFVGCESEKEINELWEKLSPGGIVRMGLDKYPFSERYGWIEDRFGMSWQLIMGKRKQKITPAFLFVREKFGKGEAAINFYSSIFENSQIEMMARDEETKTVAHAAFTLAGEHFVLMEGRGEHKFDFTPAFSLVVQCKNQNEIDKYWKELSADPKFEQCGWLQDKFGVSWQIVPDFMSHGMKDPVKADKVMKALLKMKKLDYQALKNAME
jgi:predicted 3-demethylubiquinone-9 3-methyltransferase (glyoxalase superfamily)